LNGQGKGVTAFHVLIRSPRGLCSFPRRTHNIPTPRELAKPTCLFQLPALDRFLSHRRSCPNQPRIFAKQDSKNMPYNLGPHNQYDANSTYLSPYDWLYGPYAPPFVLENFDNLAFSEVRMAVHACCNVCPRCMGRSELTWCWNKNMRSRLCVVVAAICRLCKPSKPREIGGRTTVGNVSADTKSPLQSKALLYAHAPELPRCILDASDGWP